MLDNDDVSAALSASVRASGDISSGVESAALSDTSALAGRTPGLRSRGYGVRVPTRPQDAPEPPWAARFWAKAERGSGCWEWRAGRNRHGYGLFQMGSRRVPGSRRQELAHRMAWLLAHGSLTPGLVVRHLCGNAACVRAEHLEEGTQHENCRDTVRMARTTFGRRHPRAVLTDATAGEILRRRSAGESCRALGREFGVDSSLVYQIARGTAWPHLSRHLEPAQ